jgi:HlyD family secretion protein
MTRQRVGLLVVVLLLGAGAAYFIFHSRATDLVLTGIVTTNDVIVSPQIAGRIDQLLVKEGDTVHAGQLLAVIAPGELQADSAYYTHSAEGFTSQVQESEAALRYQEQQTADQIHQAEASVASADAQERAAEADLEIARLTLERDEQLVKEGAVSAAERDQARATYDASKAKVESLKKQVDAVRASLALAQANGEQNTVKRRQLEASQHQRAAADAQRTKADVRLSYAELHAPVDGVVDVRAVRAGEFVNAGQPVVTLVNPDDLWVRVDVEETYIDRVKLGDTLTVRLPSGLEAPGTVFFRGVDAGFATQRDVSRTKRDIKTFEVRLRVDNHDRHLALGMTAYVLLPVGR